MVLDHDLILVLFQGRCFPSRAEGLGVLYQHLQTGPGYPRGSSSHRRGGEGEGEGCKPYER